MRFIALLLLTLGLSQPAFAQGAPGARSRGVARDIAPPPIAPNTITRTANGAVTVRAVRIAQPLKLDGRLDETYYRDIPSFGDFIQQDPHEGAPATEKTEVWIFFDD